MRKYYVGIPRQQDTTPQDTTPQVVNKTSSGVLVESECLGTIISNYGQTSDVTLTLPAAFANGSFIVRIDTTVAKYFRLDPNGSEVQMLDGTDLGAGKYIGLTSAAKGAVIKYIALQTSVSSYQWAAYTVVGNWTAES